MRLSFNNLFVKIFLTIWATTLLFSAIPITFIMFGDQHHKHTFYEMALQDMSKNVHRELGENIKDGNFKRADELINKARELLGRNIYIFNNDLSEINDKKFPEYSLELISQIHGDKVVIVKDKYDDESMRGPVLVFSAGEYKVVSSTDDDLEPAYLRIFMHKHIRVMMYVFLLSSIVSFVIVRIFRKPLLTISGASKRIAEGDFSVRVGDEVNSTDAMGKLANDFDKMADRLEKTRDNQEAMLRNISHELRSPLTRLRLSLELARAKAGQGADGALDRIETESERLNEMIGHLLEISRIRDSHNMPIAPVDINEILSQIVADNGFEAAEYGKTLDFSGEVTAKVSGNRKLLISGIENVVRNAIKYAENTIYINVYENIEKVVIKISDDGSGVEGNHLNDIFTPFYRVEDDRDRKTGGTGLGLAIAKAVFDAHNGSVTAYNEKGLTVEIILPVS